LTSDRIRFKTAFVKHSKRQEDKAFYEELGRRIRDARKKRKPILTQDELARQVGLTRTSITNVEHGRQKCLIHTLADLARVLQVDAASLLPVVATPRIELDDALKNRPKAEKDWILSAVTAAQKGKKHDS
jgi:DNA-binding XRE family transcriptional regulator